MHEQLNTHLLGAIEELVETVDVKVDFFALLGCEEEVNALDTIGGGVGDEVFEDG